MPSSPEPFTFSTTALSCSILDDNETCTIPTLRFLCLETTIELICNSPLGSGELRRDARGKRTIRRLLDEMLPRQLQIDLINRAVRKNSMDCTEVVRMMELFEPKSVIQDELDLLGNFRNVHVSIHHWMNNTILWGVRALGTRDLDTEHCNRLYDYIQWSGTLHKKHIRKFAIQTEPHALATSRLPHILAQSSSLTSVTVITGGTNHILRILGRNCPSLKLLDVTLSIEVTDAGLAGLLLKQWRSHTLHPFRKMTIASARAFSQEEKNPCSASLVKVILVGTSVTLRATDLACIILGRGSYYVGFHPDSIITRPLGGKTVGVERSSVNLSSADSLLPIFGGDENEGVRKRMRYIVKTCAERFEGRGHGSDIMDHHFVPDWGYGQSFIRGKDTHLIEAMIGTRLHGTSFHITELILSFYSFFWNATTFPDLNELGLNLPTLVVLKGRIQGNWGVQNRKLFPNLKITDVWTVNDATVLSFLEFCPRIQIFKFNCLDAARPANNNLVLNDVNFCRCLDANESLLKSVKEFTISVTRIGSHLTVQSVQFLLDHAPKLRRLGDLACWNLTWIEVAALEIGMTATNSQCSLITMEYPPKENVEYLL